jgi:hypothetical protein
MSAFRGCLLVLVLLTWVDAAENALPPTAPAQVHTEAQRILSRMKSSVYQHQTEIDEEQGVYKLDCSSFVSIILEKAWPDSLKSVSVSGKHHPLAVDFYDTIERAALTEVKTPEATAPAHWRRIASMLDAQPGDVLAWRKAELIKGENTGHVMIVAAAPVKEEDGQVRITVIDSSGHGHGDDTRNEDDSGLGRGSIWLRLDADGHATGFRLKSAKGPLNRTSVIVGRVE